MNHALRDIMWGVQALARWHHIARHAWQACRTDEAGDGGEAVRLADRLRLVRAAEDVRERRAVVAVHDQAACASIMRALMLIRQICHR